GFDRRSELLSEVPQRDDKAGNSIHSWKSVDGRHLSSPARADVAIDERYEELPENSLEPGIPLIMTADIVSGPDDPHSAPPGMDDQAQLLDESPQRPFP